MPAAVAWLLLCALTACGPDPGQGDLGELTWGQAQSHLEVLDGLPLVSANWHGRHRPYVHDGEAFRAVIRTEPVGADDLDLYAPLPLSPREILLSGTRSGRAEHDLYLYDIGRAVLVNLTETVDLDEGRACLHPESRKIAYRAGAEQRFARVGQGLEPLEHTVLPALHACLFLDAGGVLGVERRPAGPVLQRCRIDGVGVACREHGALRSLDHVLGLVRTDSGGAAVVGRLRGAPFRSIFLLDASLEGLRPLAPEPPVEADVLGHSAGAFRLGRESRYWSTLDPDFEGVVYRTRRIRGAHYAIVATRTRGRTLARLDSEGWQLLDAPAAPPQEPIAFPEELWLTSSRSGERYQAFRFAPVGATGVVVWWHGGPHENVSPRFNPWFHALNRLGWAVLAVNYPGSTGRGAAYERRFEPRSLVDCLGAVWEHLAQSEAGPIVSWSVSSGVTVQSLLLGSRLPLDGAVDLSGWGRSPVVAQAARREVPLFVIRGRNDANAPSPRVDHWYADGHDIALAAQFEATMEAVAGFLEGLEGPGAGGPRVGRGGGVSP